MSEGPHIRASLVASRDIRWNRRFQEYRPDANPALVDFEHSASGRILGMPHSWSIPSGNQEQEIKFCLLFGTTYTPVCREGWPKAKPLATEQGGGTLPGAVFGLS